MANSGNKTVPTDVSPAAFIATVENATRRGDAQMLLSWFEEVTGLEPVMWGSSIIGYGRYRYKYESGREGESMLTGFSPRKSAMTVYIMPGYRSPEMQHKLSRLGKHKLGKSCLYIGKLADIDMQILRKIVEDGVHYMQDNYETWER